MSKRPALHPTLDLGEPVKRRKGSKAYVYAAPPATLRWLTADPCSLDLPDSPKAVLPRMGLCWREGTRIVAAGSLGMVRVGPDVVVWTVRVFYPTDMAEQRSPNPAHVAHMLSHPYTSDFLAFRAIARQIPGEEAGSFPVRALVMEEGRGGNPKSLAQQGECRGALRNAASEAGCEWAMKLDPSQWAKAAGQAFGVKFPAKSKDRKALGLELARERHRFALGDKDTDVSDAIMQSEAAMYLGVLPTTDERQGA